MKIFRWQVLLGLSLAVLSVLAYLLHYTIFRDPHHIFIYLLGDIAFVFIEVLLVTLIIHHLLSMREKRAKLEKLNMVIGVFFGEFGTELLARFSDFDPRLEEIRKELIVTPEWSEKEFANTSRRLKSYEYSVDIRKIDLVELRGFLTSRNELLLRLLENPILLEHESFAELLRAVSHLTEELVAREDLGGLPESDLKHLTGDVKRAYNLLVDQWVAYMKYLRSNYPYLFSLAVRKNPFDRSASPVVK